MPRTTLALMVIALALATPLWAQQPDAAALQRVRMSLQQPEPSVLNGPIPQLAPPKIPRLGILTFPTPETRGEMVRVNVPVGELVSRAVRAIKAKQRRRAEEKVRAEVDRFLADLKAQQAKLAH